MRLQKLLFMVSVGRKLDYISQSSDIGSDNLVARDRSSSVQHQGPAAMSWSI